MELREAIELSVEKYEDLYGKISVYSTSAIKSRDNLVRGLISEEPYKYFGYKRKTYFSTYIHKNIFIEKPTRVNLILWLLSLIECKKCSKCNKISNIIYFHKERNWCIDCTRLDNNSRAKIKSKEWYRNNKEKINKRGREYYKNNTNKLIQYQIEYRVKHKDEINTKNREKYKQNPSKYILRTANRELAKLNRTPKWLTKEDFMDIENIYKESSKRTKESGVQHHVDHIIPLQGKIVSGLHVPNNLQVLTATENLQKSNKFEGE